MDGINIVTQVDDWVRENNVYDENPYPFALEDDVPDEEIQNIIELNEPGFKHTVKLTPNLTHPSLKKRVNSRRSFNDLDDSDSGEIIETVSPVDSKGYSQKDRSRKYRETICSLQAEIMRLKTEKKQVKVSLESTKKNLIREIKQLNRILQKRLVTLHKFDATLKRRGRKIGGAKLLRELGINHINIDKDENEETVIVENEIALPQIRKSPQQKRRRGRPRKNLALPLKEKNLNQVEKTEKNIDNDVSSPINKSIEKKPKKEEVPRRSRREIRYTEKFAGMLQSTRQLADVDSLVIRKSINEVEPEKAAAKKRKNDGPLLKSKKLKVDDEAAARARRAESVASDSTSCRSVKQVKQAMMKGVTTRKVCEICTDHTDVRCQQCFTYLHPSCVGDDETANESDWTCPTCKTGQNNCFVCKSDEGTRQMCLTDGCGKFYHKDCLKLFPQTKYNHGERKGKGAILDSNANEEPPLEILACARHFCHTCASDNPFEAQIIQKHKLLVCLKCPTSYHYSPGVCLTAGTEILSTTDMICGKHFEPGLSKAKRQKLHHINITWCFVCTKGGDLANCATCPSAIHPDCLNIPRPDGPYYCDECESGRFPLHGEIVWAKLSSFRWWPSRILYPDEIPKSLLNVRHRQCEFAIMFFGSKDYQWVSRGRTFLFNEGDGQNVFRAQKRLDKSFQLALTEATEAFQQRKSFIETNSSKSKEKPQRFTKIRVNKYKNRAQKRIDCEPHVCNCSSDEAEPCGPSSNCINRGLLIECNTAFCPAGVKCCNQQFTKRQYPPLNVFKTKNRGWGVRCEIDLTQGQFVLEYVGEVIDNAELEKRMKIKWEGKNSKYYFLRLDSHQVLDAEPMGNTARFINHSCRPNCETQKWTVNGLTQIGIFACRDIPRDTELTFNYDWTIDGVRSVCYCGDAACSGIIGEIPSLNKRKQTKDIKKNDKKKLKTKAVGTFCGKCQENGTETNLLICSDVKCLRVLHMSCANITEKPDNWLCSAHACAVCGAKTKRCCTECFDAFCAVHATKYIQTNQKGHLVCIKHNLEKQKRGTRKSTYLAIKEEMNSGDSLQSSASDCASTDICANND